MRLFALVVLALSFALPARADELVMFERSRDRAGLRKD
jgi:hypothetical protein